MTIISDETFAKASEGSRVRGRWLHFWTNGRPLMPMFPDVEALEINWGGGGFVLHRHRAGARKVRRILRRAKHLEAT